MQGLGCSAYVLRPPLHRRHSPSTARLFWLEKKAAGLWVKFWVDDGIADRSFLGLHLITFLFADWFLTKHRLSAVA